MKSATLLRQSTLPEMDTSWSEILDHHSCHPAMVEDALDAGKMNVDPGGKQPAMWNTVWAGKPQKRYHKCVV